MKPLIKFLTLSFFLILISCDSKDAIPEEENVVFKAYLNGGNATPVNNSGGMGIATLTFNPNSNDFSITVQYFGLSATSASVYSNHGDTPEHVISFPDLESETIYYGSLDSVHKEDLYANNFILNVHTSSFPEGEICGLLIRQNNGNLPPPPPPTKILHHKPF